MTNCVKYSYICVNYFKAIHWVIVPQITDILIITILATKWLQCMHSKDSCTVEEPLTI